MKNAHVRHFFCPNCASYHRPFKRQAGITRHLIRYLNFVEGQVFYAATCLICEVVRRDDGKLEITKERRGFLSKADWNALMNFKPGDDGYYD